MRNLLWILVPYIAFGITIGVNLIAQEMILPRCTVVCYCNRFLSDRQVFSLVKRRPTETLMIFGRLGIVAMLIQVDLPPVKLPPYAFLSGGLFCSIMWLSNIFSLAIAGFGENIRRRVPLSLL